MGCCFPDKMETSRTIYFQRQNNYEWPPNQIDTTKYSALTFLPKAILLQFVRPANFVYLLAAILQSIDVISSLEPITAVAPFVFVIGISLVRQGYEDYKRYKKDKEINNRQTHRLLEKQFQLVRWQQIKVGDIIKVKNNQIIPADFLLLHSTEENSLCYVETANLDGQSNLKSKFAFVDDIKLYPEDFQSIIGKITIDPPNSDLHSFSGMIEVQGKEQKPIDFQNVLLRETILKNTDEVVGVVLYSGFDTKIIQNQGDVDHKVSHVERKVNMIQLFLLITLLLLSLICCLGFHAYHGVQNTRQSLVYLHPKVEDYTTQVALIYFSSLLLLTFLIPISLNVSIEVIKAFLGIFLGFDDKMYYKQIDKRCSVLNISIIEQLGQIDFVLTDKTGTLTANQMIFKYLTLGNENYHADEIKYRIKEFHKKHQFLDFWIGLLICHEVVCDPETSVYQGSSPDEVCFINFARQIGYQFIKRTKNSIELNVQGKKIVYQLLNVLPFTSRKRMSVIVKDLQKNQIIIYTKGADSALFQKSLLHKQQSELKYNINRYATQGYRTLLFSTRKISTPEYQSLTKLREEIKNMKAKRTHSKSEIEAKQLYLIENFEQNLQLLGATAIEDRLQDDVPETIARLQEAGIIVMMITGDKLQTAENIGYLAKFIKSDSTIYRIQAGQTNSESIIHKVKQTSLVSRSPLTLIIEGTSIHQFINGDNPQHAEVLNCVSSVIFCRSSPRQKAEIVKFVKEKLSGTVLAIGDGGNDVGMIQEAHVGVGILGKEGNSASAASDFSIGQFKYLDRLLLHHGRWFYYRLSYFFVFYGWKNLIMTLILFFFMIDSVFSAQPGLSDPFIAIYNIIIGLSLVVYYSVFEQDINDDQYSPAWAKLPSFYKETKKSDLFSYRRYIIWTVFACIIAIVLFVITRFSMGSTSVMDSEGHTPDFGHQAQALSISLCLSVVYVIISDFKMYTYFLILIVIGLLTVVGTVGFFLIENYIDLGDNYLAITNSSFRFWAVVFVNWGIIYAGKLFLETIHFEMYETGVEEMLRIKNYEQQNNFAHVTHHSQMN